MAGRLAGKVAVITGASRGLGQYCAVGFGREGATVVVAARTETAADSRLPGTIHETVDLVKAAGGDAMAVACNVADYASVGAMAQQVLDRYGRIDVLMTNAAIQPPGRVSTMEIKHWELEFRVNVHGSFYPIRAFLPSMQAAGSGNIITISSIAAHRGGSHYGATKRAIESMTIGLADELREQGIAANCLRPVGGIETPGFMMARTPGQPNTPSTMSNFPPPDSYVEAAILYAMQTPSSCTGAVLTDAEVVQRFAPQELDRFKAMNPQDWSASLAASAAG
jgi:NAD(P)-dependent dehydrogenase (short-subunit alcohol dehydrogenase family)